MLGVFRYVLFSSHAVQHDTPKKYIRASAYGDVMAAAVRSSRTVSEERYQAVWKKVSGDHILNLR